MPEEGMKSIAKGYESPHGCWELNSRPLREQVD